MTVMGVQREQAERIETLRGLIERLSAPNLTLDEAKDLRGRISELLGREDQPAAWDPLASSPALVPSRGRGDEPRHEIWSSEISMRVAG
jgi:hypothetical protein